MTKKIFLLGPNEWDEGVEAPPPLWIETLLGTKPIPFTPKHLREAAAVKIASESSGRVQGIIMDPKDQARGEDDVAFFQRLEKEHKIGTYFFIMPLGCKLLGTTFEAGMLQRDFAWGRNPEVLLFVQDGIAQVDDNENWQFKERGHRTRYFSSLAGVAHHVHPWKNYEKLIDDVVSWAMLEDGY